VKTREAAFASRAVALIQTYDFIMFSRLWAITRRSSVKGWGDLRGFGAG